VEESLGTRLVYTCSYSLFPSSHWCVSNPILCILTIHSITNSSCRYLEVELLVVVNNRIGLLPQFLLLPSLQDEILPGACQCWFGTLQDKRPCTPFIASYPGLLAPAFVACSTNAGEVLQATNTGARRPGYEATPFRPLFLVCLPLLLRLMTVKIK